MNQVMMRRLWPLVFMVVMGLARAQETSDEPVGHPAAGDARVHLGNATIFDLQAAFERGTLDAERLVRLYLARIEAFEAQGPAINSIINLNRNALARARALDRERDAGRVRGPLHGIPFSLKDNINTADLPTTAGSCLLADSVPPADAFVVKRLRDAGAILLSKDNLSEFASGGGSVAGAADPRILRAGDIPQGYSSVGGQTRNPHDRTRVPAGSSGGTGAGIASAFAQFGLGSDTKSSVRGPAAANGIVGLRPTTGLLSRNGLVPLALSFDTIGPMARNVYDVAVVLGVMTGVDSDDAATKESTGRFETDYTRFLKAGALKGARIGIGWDFVGDDPEIRRVFDEAVAAMERLGAEIIDPIRFPQYVYVMADEPIFPLIRNAEFKSQIPAYLRTLAPGYPKTLEELAASAAAPDSCYQKTSPEKAFALGYSAAIALDLDDPVYIAALEHGVRLVKAGVQAVFENHDLDAVVFPTSSRLPGRIEAADAGAGRAAVAEGRTALEEVLAGGVRQIQAGRTGSLDPGMASASLISPYSGLPELVIPAGITDSGLPVTISFIGRPFGEPRLLGYGFDFERAVRARTLPAETPPLQGEIIVR